MLLYGTFGKCSTSLSNLVCGYSTLTQGLSNNSVKDLVDAAAAITHAILSRCRGNNRLVLCSHLSIVDLGLVRHGTRIHTISGVHVTSASQLGEQRLSQSLASELSGVH